MRLYEMNRHKSDFLATVSHELRTPLNSIIGFSDVLASLEGLSDKHLRYLQNIQTSGKMLLEMINDILDLAKIEAGKMEIRLSDFRIDHVLHSQCDMARPLVEKKNLDLAVDVRPGMPELHQDQSKVQQILNNLLSNAIKFTPDGGRITVRAEPAGPGYFHLVVADTGVGIAEADRTRIFEKFRQGASVSAGDAMTREYSGTGLGLSIVKELCKLLGGEIMLDSELGKGSIFTVRLPLRMADQPDGDNLAATLSDGFTASRRGEFATRSRPMQGAWRSTATGAREKGPSTASAFPAANRWQPLGDRRKWLGRVSDRSAARHDRGLSHARRLESPLLPTAHGLRAVLAGGGGVRGGAGGPPWRWPRTRRRRTASSPRIARRCRSPAMSIRCCGAAASAATRAATRAPACGSTCARDRGRGGRPRSGRVRQEHR